MPPQQSASEFGKQIVSQFQSLGFPEAEARVKEEGIGADRTLSSCGFALVNPLGREDKEVLTWIDISVERCPVLGDYLSLSVIIYGKNETEIQKIIRQCCDEFVRNGFRVYPSFIRKEEQRVIRKSSYAARTYGKSAAATMFNE